MDYKRHYELLIKRAISRGSVDGYSEKHHIIPRCKGGGNEPSNLAVLTPEEHYLAHLLLVKIYPGDHKLIWAASRMCSNGPNMQRNNKYYGWLRRQFAKMVSEHNSGRKMSDEFREMRRALTLGRKRGPHSEETKAKMRAASRGKPKSAEHRAAISKAQTGSKRGPHTQETKDKIRASNILAPRDLSFTQDPAYRLEQSKRMKEIWQMRRDGVVPMPVYEIGE